MKLRVTFGHSNIRDNRLLTERPSSAIDNKSSKKSRTQAKSDT